MAFDIHKYDNTRFSSDDLTHKRVKALFLWFEYEVYKNDIPVDGQISLLDNWIKKLLQQEYYEVVPYFKKRRNDMIKDVDKVETAKVKEEIVKVAYEEPKVSFLSRVTNNIKETYKVIFKRK